MIVQILSLNDDDDDAKALPTGVPKVEMEIGPLRTEREQPF